MTAKDVEKQVVELFQYESDFTVGGSFGELKQLSYEPYPDHGLEVVDRQGNVFQITITQKHIKGGERHDNR